ncbi:Cytochrome P450 [Methylobacterium sp. 275MFSha3.1]|uniref:cytochrome P450 n=1 Tax=Methylobacterium sp. 275MFSha3.1 TaxID=1502746 RepID=UPI0008A7AAD8|nr:cytochrome P450 [Methylobacterium sp. 275MFSha3.1]SEI01784.1 Cytochrome P450 [Methylobacterium sp. 275MFSha3.1]
MSALTSTDPYRAPGGVRGWLTSRVLAAAPFVMRILRRWWPIAGGHSIWIVTRFDDVVEVFANDAAFGVPYAENLRVITGGELFFLGMGDTPEYRVQLEAMRSVVRREDLPALGDEAEARAQTLVDRAGGRVEVVQLVRRVSFDLIASYFGVPEPRNGRLEVWGTRLFEFQFTGSLSDQAWVDEVSEIARAFREHIDSAVVARKGVRGQTDDVLERCLAKQDDGRDGFSDAEIRTALLCMVVGGPPQPPMVVTQALEQLLRRPAWLGRAGSAAREGRDSDLHDIVFEAMRFDPLAPGLKRLALTDNEVAAGTSRARTIPKGATVVAAFASAMMDERRIAEPQSFDPGRPAHNYVHFGHGLHECFGRHINHAILHRILKPLLAKPDLRRAGGPRGRLKKRGAFAERLEVIY